MITYNPAFDLYHTLWRMAHILQRWEQGDTFEVERMRIWDFYLLFPSKLYDVRLNRTELDLQQARKTYIEKERTPYEYRGNNRQLFEWIRPVQLSAISCLVSCGILDKNAYLTGRIVVERHDVLSAFINHGGSLTPKESNVLSFMGLLFRHIPLKGSDGLKARTRLLEFKYDAE